MTFQTIYGIINYKEWKVTVIESNFYSRLFFRKERIMLDIIDKFDGEYSFLSNFYNSPIIIGGINYPTVDII